MSWLFGTVEMKSPSGLVRVTLPTGLLRRRWTVEVEDEVRAEGRSWRNARPVFDSFRALLPSLPVPAQYELERLIESVEH